LRDTVRDSNLILLVAHGKAASAAPESTASSERKVRNASNAGYQFLATCWLLLKPKLSGYEVVICFSVVRAGSEKYLFHGGTCAIQQFHAALPDCFNYAIIDGILFEHFWLSPSDIIRLFLQLSLCVLCSTGSDRFLAGIRSPMAS
jgi:hypothetical protein